MNVVNARFEANVFKDASEEVLKLCLEQAQVQLKSQLDLAQNADRRAQGLLAVCAAFSSAAITVALSSFTTGQLYLGWGASVCAVVWIVGAAASLKSMAPMRMWTPGWEPNWLVKDVVAGKEYRRILQEVLVYLDKYIVSNRQMLIKNGRYTLAAMVALIVAPIAGAIAAYVCAVMSGSVLSL